METADDIARWVLDRLSWLPESGRVLAGIPVLFVVTLVALNLAVRFAIPRLGAALVGWLVPAAGFALAVVLLTLDFAAVQPLRWAGLRPPGIMFAYGNSTVEFENGLRRLCRMAVRQIRRLRRFWQVLLVAISIAAVYRWSQHYCAREHVAPCAPPAEEWWGQVREVIRWLSR